MTFKSLKCILLITLLGFSAFIHAEQIDNPYQGSILVESFDEAQLKAKALKQVLIKVSGNAEIGSRDETKLLIKKTQQLLSQYGYRKIQGQEYFSAVFDQSKINQALIDMQQPIWGDTRPTTLIWLVNNNELVSDHFIKKSEDNALSWSIQQSEQQRGIRVQFPLMDLDDNLALSISDVKGQFYDQLSSASARYERANFVAAELQSVANDRWKLNWQLIQSGAVVQQNNVLLSETFVGNKSEVVKKMVNAIADYYASQYAILDNQGEKFTQTIHIKGINSLQTLTQLNTVLKNLLSISSYNIVNAQGDQVSVTVKLNGGLNSFKNALIAQSQLQLIEDLPAQVEPENLLTEPDEDNGIEPVSEPVKTDELYFNWH